MRTQGPAVAVLGAALAGLATAPAVTAQQPATRGWLGVKMTHYYECLWETNTDWKACDLVMSVDGVQADGPAANAGIRPGDKMVALNGEEFTYETVNRLIPSIRPGAPVSVDFMRDGVRRYVHVTPTVPPSRPEAIRWVGSGLQPRPRVFVREDGPRSAPRAFVITLSDIDEDADGTYAITIRNTGSEGVSVEPAALRVVDGQIRLMELDDANQAGLENLRDQLAVDLRLIQDSTYRKATDALRVLANIRGRLPQEDFRRQLARLAPTRMNELRFGARLYNTFAGAEFEVASAPLANAVEAGREGLLVIRVVPGTPAARLGLRPGDVLFEAEGLPLRDLVDLRRVIDATDGALEVKWSRKGTEHEGRLPGQ